MLLSKSPKIRWSPNKRIWGGMGGELVQISQIPQAASCPGGSCPSRIHPHYSGAEKGFCCNNAGTCSSACLCQAGTATDLSSDTKPSPGTRGKIPVLAEASSAHHSTPCFAQGGSPKLSSSLPPSLEAFLPSVLINSTNGALLLSHGILGRGTQGLPCASRGCSSATPQQHHWNFGDREPQVQGPSRTSFGPSRAWAFPAVLGIPSPGHSGPR